MAIIPNQIATMGLYPGWETFMAATLGHWFEVRLEFLPIQHGSVAKIRDLQVPPPIGPGTGGKPDVCEVKPEDVFDSRRLVRLTVRYKQHEWQQEMEIDTLAFKRIDVTVTKWRQFRDRGINVTASLYKKIRSVITVTSKKK